MNSRFPERIICYPAYRANDYLNLIYKEFDIPVLLCGYNPSDAGLKEVALPAESNCRSMIHIHWIQELYSCDNRISLYRFAENLTYLEQLKLRSCSLAWTIHNVHPHEWRLNEQSVYRKALSEVYRLCDIIFQHSQNGVQLTEQFLGMSLRNKPIVTVPHPLYEKLPIDTLKCPPELASQNLDNFMLLFGMIRPYKGTSRLLRLYKAVAMRLGDATPSLVIAGRIYDPGLVDNLLLMKDDISSIILLDRRLLESELGWLIHKCRFCVQPYLNILSSGSYYHATTYETLCVVPRLGEFLCERSDSSVLQAFSSDEELENLLTYLSLIPRDRLDLMGRQALISNMNRDPRIISKKYYDSLKAL